MTLRVMDEYAMRVAEQMADPRNPDLVAGLRFGNLTRPLISQMSAGDAWGPLVSIAHRLEEARRNGHRANGNWAARCPSGSAQFAITPKGLVNVVLLFTSAHHTVGPDELRGRRLSVAGATLPETLMTACRGRLVREVVDDARHHGAVSGERVRRARAQDWGLALELELDLVQPTAAELEAMMAARDVNPWN